MSCLCNFYSERDSWKSQRIRKKNSIDSFDHAEDSSAYSEKITPSTSQKILTCTTGKEGYFVMSVLTWACSPIAANTLITTLGSWSLNLGISAWKI